MSQRIAPGRGEFEEWNRGGEGEEEGNGPEGIRTPDLRDANAALSQLSHRPTDALIIKSGGGSVKVDALARVIPRPLTARPFLASRAGVLLHCGCVRPLRRHGDAAPDRG